MQSLRTTWTLVERLDLPQEEQEGFEGQVSRKRQGEGQVAQSGQRKVRVREEHSGIFDVPNRKAPCRLLQHPGQ